MQLRKLSFMSPLYNRGFCSSSRQNLVKSRSLLEVNDEILLDLNEEIGQKHHLRMVSFITCLALATTQGFGEDYVRVEVLQYNENDSRVSVLAPTIEVNKEFGTDYTLNVDIVADSVSGASPTYYDTASGASAYSRGVQNDPTKIKKGNVNFEEQRTAIGANLTTRFDSRDELQTGINFSAEHDFYSAELSGSYLHYLDGSKNQSLTIGGSYQNNQILKKQILQVVLARN